MTIPATLSLKEAARRTWDVLVVGAGPAGALAAHQCGTRGAATLLVDRAAFPRGKVCGCCLNGRALAALQAVGLGDLPTTCGAVPLRAMELRAGTQSALLTLAGVALSRETFDAALVRAAQRAGAHFLPQTRAALAPGDAVADCRRTWLHGPAASVEVRARCVLAADGLGGKLLARAGLGAAPPAAGARIGVGTVVDAALAPAQYQPGTVYMACGARGYVGLVRLEDSRLDLAAALDPEEVHARGSPGRAVAALLAGAGLVVPVLDAQAWHGTAALTRRALRCASGRLFVVGDAAGYVEPFTGEGMAWALEAARSVAPLALAAARSWQPGLVRTWEAFYQHRTHRQLLCRTAAAVLRRPFLARSLIRLLAHAPFLAAPVVQYLNGFRSSTPGLLP